MIAKNNIERAYLKYYGAKYNLASWIISYFPHHESYVEPCAGVANVLMQKPRSKLETINDIDGNVVNFFRMLRENTDELVRMIRLTPWARAEHETVKVQSNDPMENARRFFMGCWMSISSMPFNKITGFRTVSFHGQSYVNTAERFYVMVDSTLLLRIADRLKGVQIENRDASYVVERYDHENALIYFDPPYLKETRISKNQYLADTDDNFHIKMAKLLLKAKGNVVISGYASQLYKELYEDNGWVRQEKIALNNGGNKNTECLWLSPKTVKAVNLPRQASMFNEKI